MIKTVNANTKLGQRLAQMGQNWEGKYLNQVYDKWSKAKEDAWNKCFEMCSLQHGECFGITSHNTYGFSVSWFTSEGMHYVTKSNHYLVIWE